MLYVQKSPDGLWYDFIFLVDGSEGKHKWVTRTTQVVSTDDIQGLVAWINDNISEHLTKRAISPLEAH